MLGINKVGDSVMRLNQDEIVFVVTSMGRGGAERVVSILANRYASIDWKVHIIMLWHNNIGYDLDPRIKIHDISDDSMCPYIQIPRIILKLRKEIIEIAPRTVVSFIAHNNVITNIAISGLGVRFVPSERIDPSAVHRNSILRLAVKHTYQNSSLTVLQTKRAFDFFSEKIQQNSTIIYNPIQVSSEATYSDRKWFVSAGRLETEKNQMMLIKAFACFSKCYPEYTMTIFGDGKMKSNLLNLVSELGLKDRVFLPGNVSNLQEQIKEASCFILPSNREGMSNALMEAMAIGLPCISTNCSGSDELITNGENGILIPVGDERALIEAMKYVAENSTSVNIMGQEARKFSECFSVDCVFGQWREAIEGAANA